MNKLDTLFIYVYIYIAIIFTAMFTSHQLRVLLNTSIALYIRLPS